MYENIMKEIISLKKTYKILTQEEIGNSNKR